MYYVYVLRCGDGLLYTGFTANLRSRFARHENGTVEVAHDRHIMGLFPRAIWLELIAEAGFEPLAVPFEHDSYSNTGHEILLGLRPVADGGA